MELIYITSIIIISSLLGATTLGLILYKRSYDISVSRFNQVDLDDYLHTKDELTKLKEDISILTNENIRLTTTKINNKRRRGLYKRVVVRSRDKYKINIECEVREIDKAVGKSKVEVIHVNSEQVLEDSQIEDVKKIVNGWLNDSDIEWLQTPLNELRDSKINDILKENK